MQSKKPMMLNILKILQVHSDRAHRLDLTEIVQYLETEYHMKAERKAVKRNLMELEQCGFDIRYSEIVRSRGLENENTVCKDYYLERDFTDGELEFLISAVLFCPHIARRPAQDLIHKLAAMGSITFRNSCPQVPESPFRTHSQEFFLNLEELNAAIRKKRMVSFTVLSCGRDRQLHPVQSGPCTVSPYWIVVSKGSYYLMAAREGEKAITPFRIDRMSSVQVSESRAALPVNEISDAPADAEALLSEHSSLCSGPVQNIRFTIPEGLLDHVVDQFGMNFRITQNDNGLLYILLHSASEDVFPWAMEHGDSVTVLQPARLRARIRDTARAMRRAYAD